MADYVSIIAKAVEALAENTPSNREIIYDKARATIDRKLRAMDPSPGEEVIARQLEQLDAAISQVENEHSSEADVAADALAAAFSQEDEQADSGQVADAAVSPAYHEAYETPASAMPADGMLQGVHVLPEAADSVILIDGIGEKTQQNLAAEGITRLSQIAAMDEQQLALITEKLGIPGFEKTQEWKAQANSLLAGMPPRTKTDQDRLQRMLEEAGAAGEVSEAATDLPEAQEAPALPDAETPQTPVEETGSAAGHDVGMIAGGDAVGQSEFADSNPFLEPEADRAAVADTVTPDPAPAENLSGDDHPVSPVEPVTAASGQVEPEMVGHAADMAPQTAPATPQQPRVQPDFVAQIDGEPPLGSRQEDFGIGRQVPPPRRKGGAGKAIGWLAFLSILGAAGAGAWYYQDEVKQAGGKAYDAISELLNSGESADQPTAGTDTQDGNAADDGTAVDGQKDTTRLGSNGETVRETPPQDTVQDGGSESGQPTDLLATPDQSQTSEEASGTSSGADDQAAVRDVTPTDNGDQPSVVSVDEQGAGGANATGDESATEPLPGTDEGNNAQTAQNDSQNGSAEPQVAIVSGEKAFLYEEGFGNTGASRDDGSVSWELANEPPEQGATPEAVIKGLVDIPSRGMQMNITVKRNVDAALPASHIIELLFTLQPGFSGGNIDQVSRFVMKATEQARGESLVGVPARIDAGFFLIALNNLQQAQQTNESLLESGQWIDIPLTYLTGRRGLITLEKGASGEKVFAEALADWKNR